MITAPPEADSWTTPALPALDPGLKLALREMIKLVGERLGLAAEDAYMFSSLAVDLRVTQLVDGNKGIHAMLPKRYANRTN